MDNTESTESEETKKRKKQQEQLQQPSELEELIELLIRMFLKMLRDEFNYKSQFSAGGGYSATVNNEYQERDEEEIELQEEFYSSFMKDENDPSQENFHEFEQRYEKKHSQSQGSESQHSQEHKKEAEPENQSEPAEEDDHYKTLGVSRDAEPKDIRKAFLKQSLANHPDKVDNTNPEAVKEATETFKKITKANECLSDPDKRRSYDDANPHAGVNFRTPRPSPFK